MEEFTRSLFKTAVIKERAAQKLYTRLLDKALSKETRELLKTIIQEEKIHEELFSKMNINILRKVNSSDLNKLRVKVNTKDNEDLDINELNSVLDIAIKEEQKACDDYSLLLDHVLEDEARQTLKEIIVQEKTHKTMLQKLKLELNDNDWRVI